MSKCDIPAEKS